MNNCVPSTETSYPLPFVLSPLFPALYFSLYNAQKHTPQITKRENIRKSYDYIIVGAGTAGSTLAGRLSEIPNVNILLLEAGKSPPVMTEVMATGRSFFRTDLDWGYFTTPQKHTGSLLNDRRVIYPRGKTVGGSNTINGAVYVRGSRHIYDKWAKGGAKGWNYENVLPYFKKMETNKNPEDIDIEYHGSEGPMTVETGRFNSSYKTAIIAAIEALGYRTIDPNGRNQKGFYNYQMNTREAQRCTTAKAYLVPAENRTNLHIVNNALVTKVIFQGKRAVKVEVIMDNKTSTIEAYREIILSAGSINTPQILMLSGVGPQEHLKAKGIPVVADLPVGRGLQDHIASFNLFYTDKLPSAYDEVTNSTNIQQYINHRTGPLATSDGQQYTAFLTLQKNTPDDVIPDYQLFFFDAITSRIPIEVNVQQKVYDETFKPYENKSVLLCASQLLQPKSVGFVELQSANPLDPPIIEPNYLQDQRDRKVVVAGLKECDRILKTKGFEKLGLKPIERKYPFCDQDRRDSNAYLECTARSIAMTIYHPTSTCKMGSSTDSSSVVDSNLRVIGLHGLRVVDASVMPIIPSGNVNAPTIMVAEKAADIIKESLTPRRLRCSIPR